MTGKLGTASLSKTLPRANSTNLRPKISRSSSVEKRKKFESSGVQRVLASLLISLWKICRLDRRRENRTARQRRLSEALDRLAAGRKPGLKIRIRFRSSFVSTRESYDVAPDRLSMHFRKQVFSLQGARALLHESHAAGVPSSGRETRPTVPGRGGSAPRCRA